MTVLSKKTCLLLGAGASKHVGFPLGDELRKKILYELLGQKDKPADELPGDFGRSGEDLQQFYDRLAYGNWSSPDAFLEKHREFIKTGKFLICRALAEHEQSWGVTSQGGWYDRLVSSIHVDDVAKLKENGLSIVTFNYDRSLDFRLHKYVENHFGLNSSTAWETLSEAIPIIHLHGTLGSYPETAYGDQSNIYERSQSINIISEIEDGLEQFRQASTLLNEAERVVVFGFGFATDNVNRLDFFKEQEEDKREILIATGRIRGQVHDREQRDWLSKWGLLPNKHYWPQDCNTFLNHVCNPFS